MIGWLKGKIVEKNDPNKFVLDVQGVGYEVEVSPQAFLQIEFQKEALSFFIHTIVREDAILLYGFLSKEERSLFRALIKINGIGPKAAMAILANISPQQFIICIQQQNLLSLTKLPGIGKKTAERLLIEMKDSVNQIIGIETMGIGSMVSSAMGRSEHHEAISALQALGYREQEAIKTINKIDDGVKTCEELIKEALQFLASKAVT